MQGGIDWIGIDPNVPAIIPLREGVKIEDVGNVGKLSKVRNDVLHIIVNSFHLLEKL